MQQRVRVVAQVLRAVVQAYLDRERRSLQELVHRRLRELVRRQHGDVGLVRC